MVNQLAQIIPVVGIIPRVLQLVSLRDKNKQQLN